MIGACGGCTFESFPYKARCIINTGSYNEIEFKDINDVWDYIMLLEKEAVDFHKKKGTNGAVITDIFHQLPFFCCPNNIIGEAEQNDISRYIYSTEARTPAYPGSYGDTPKKWLSKFWSIKAAISYRDNMIRAKVRSDKK